MSWQRQPWSIDLALALWTAAAGALLLGWRTRCAAATAWALSVSFAHLNPYIDNAGDSLRISLLFLLVFCPCGAVWSLDARRNRDAAGRPVVVHPWPLRLVFLQLVLIYFMNGLYKLLGASWPEGFSLHFILRDPTLTRFSAASFPVPDLLARAATWLVLVWEVGFPLWVAWRRTRTAALLAGVVFHLTLLLLFELGWFPLVMLLPYLTLLPWEKWSVP